MYITVIRIIGHTPVDQFNTYHEVFFRSWMKNWEYSGLLDDIG